MNTHASRMARTRIEEYDSEATLQLDDEDTNWVAQQAALQVPLVLPWKKHIVRLGTCFQSQLLHKDPWLQDKAFILSDLYMMPKVLRIEDGSTSSFHSVNTTSRVETRDHLSLGFGMGTGLPFLCSASVKGTYDEDVQKNTDSDKSSFRASARCATVQLGRNPRLCHEAIVMLKYGGGYGAFTKEYGDYFLWGYRLGGDTGLMVSESSFSTKKVDSYGVTATLEVLWVTSSKTWTKDIHSFTAGKTMRLSGYDTLSDMHWNVTTAKNGTGSFGETAKEIIVKSQNVLERTLEFLESKSFADGDNLSYEQCDMLTGMGVAVELVLLPMSALRDVARWTTESDII